MTALQHAQIIQEEVEPYRALKYAPDPMYPDSDGKPMGETGFHVRAILHLYGALTLFFQQRGDIYVAADMFWYYQEGNPRANKSPDIMVIKGVGNHERRSFKSWVEQAVPCVIFEISSASTMAEDMVTKSALYARLGVREYFIFDPQQEYLFVHAIGFCLQDDEYVSIQPDDDGRLFSEELGLFLQPEGEILRAIDPLTGQRLPSLQEAMALAYQEAERATQERQRAEQEAERAAQERQRAEQERQRAAREAARSEKLAAQLRALGIEPEA